MTITTAAEQRPSAGSGRALARPRLAGAAAVARRAPDVVRRRRLPAAHRARGGVALHAHGPAARPTLEDRARRRPAPPTYDLQTPDGVRSRTLAPGRGPARHARSSPADRAAVAGVAWHPATPCASRIPADARARRAGARSSCAAAAGSAQNAHHVIEAGRHSKRDRGDRPRRRRRSTPATSRCVVGDGADLTVVSLQRWDDDAVHLGQHDALVGRDARYKHVAVTLGGRVVRLNVERRVRGPGGDANAARPVLRRRRPAPRAPLLRRPRRAALHQPRDLQGRAAGRHARTRSGSATC